MEAPFPDSVCVCAKIAVINAEFPQFSLTGIHTERSLSWHRVYTPTAECFYPLDSCTSFLARSVHVVHVESITSRQFPSYLQDSVQCDLDLSVLQSRWPCLLFQRRGKASNRNWTQLCRVRRAGRRVPLVGEHLYAEVVHVFSP